MRPGVLAGGRPQTQQACASGARRATPRPPAPYPRQHLAQDTGCNTFGLLAGVPWCGRPATGPERSPVLLPHSLPFILPPWLLWDMYGNSRPRKQGEVEA